MSDLQVVQQFITDNKEGLREKFDDQKIKEIVDNSKLDTITVGDYLIDVELSVNGGHITIIEIQDIDSYTDWNTYGDRLGLKGINQTLLIEHPDYKSKHVEPYNRQSGFYVGYGFSNLTKETVNNWSVYSISHKENINLQTENFYFNDFWNDFKFNVAVKKQSINPMIEEITNILKFDKTVIEHISKLIK